MGAGDVVEYRKQNGVFKSREQLLQVPNIGPTRYVQAAGFLKIPSGENPLDRTWIHPESYGVAASLLSELGFGPEALDDKGRADELRQKLRSVHVDETAARLTVGAPTLRDILEALARPGRDPREDLPPPVFKKGILRIEDLQSGMELKGTVLNVVDFGAFVDIGLKDSGLVHISQMANRYIKSPYDVVAVSDVVVVWCECRSTAAPSGADDDQTARGQATGEKPYLPRQRQAASGAAARGPRPGPGEPATGSTGGGVRAAHRRGGRPAPGTVGTAGARDGRGRRATRGSSGPPPRPAPHRANRGASRQAQTVAGGTGGQGALRTFAGWARVRGQANAAAGAHRRPRIPQPSLRHTDHRSAVAATEQPAVVEAAAPLVNELKHGTTAIQRSIAVAATPD
jgi:uncharacterized protein